jgi:hypothetical protein
MRFSRPTKKGFKTVQDFRRKFDRLAESMGAIPFDDPISGRTWTFSTDAGPYRVHAGQPYLRSTSKGQHELDFKGANIDTGDLTLYGRFENPEEARQWQYFGVNPYSGKHNFHFGKVSPAEALDEFKKSMSMFRYKQTRHTSTR